MYNSVENSSILSLTTRRDKVGNVFHVVEYFNNDNSKDYACFKHLSSALDFIDSNFR